MDCGVKSFFGRAVLNIFADKAHTVRKTVLKKFKVLVENLAGFDRGKNAAFLAREGQHIADDVFRIKGILIYDF